MFDVEVEVATSLRACCIYGTTDDRRRMTDDDEMMDHDHDMERNPFSSLAFLFGLSF